MDATVKMARSCILSKFYIKPQHGTEKDGYLN